MNSGAVRENAIPAILVFLRSMPGSPPAIAKALAVVNWAELAHDAERHGLSALLQHALQTGHIDAPVEICSKLRIQTMAIAVRALRVRALLVSALDAMNKRGVTPILLKGYGLAHRLYPDPLLRLMSDVDLLPSAEQYPLAAEALIDLGLRQIRQEPPEEAGKDHQHPAFWGHERWFGGEAGLVELHWRPLSGFGTAIGVKGVWRRSRTSELEGHPIRYLKIEDEVIYLAAHAAKHLLGRLGWLYDLKLLIQSEPVDWDLALAGC